MKINNKLLDDLYWDGDDAYDYLPRIKGLPDDRWSIYEERVPRYPLKLGEDIHSQVDSLREYTFTYEASRHEAWWLFESLGPFFDEQWFDDVIQKIKGGKEASVYLCKANPSSTVERMAAKVYRPRSLRNLRKDHIYREGRPQLDSDGLNIIKERQLKAIRQRTAYGQNLMHNSWIEHEFRTMQILHDAGCDVPKPYARGHNAILMDFIGDEANGAPTLNGIKLNKPQATVLFDRVVQNIDKMLSSHRVHGDLSAYNILYWNGFITLIDFPQAINPVRNPNAYLIFQRDVIRVCEYFDKQGMKTNPKKLAEDLWCTYGYSMVPNYLPDEEEVISLL